MNSDDLVVLWMLHERYFISKMLYPITGGETLYNGIELSALSNIPVRQLSDKTVLLSGDDGVEMVINSYTPFLYKYLKVLQITNNK